MACVVCKRDDFVYIENEDEYVCKTCGTVTKTTQFMRGDAAPCQTNDWLSKQCMLLRMTCLHELYIPENVIENAESMFTVVMTKYDKKMHTHKTSAMMCVAVYIACLVAKHINAYRDKDTVMRIFITPTARYNHAYAVFRDLSVGEPWYRDMHDVRRQTYLRSVGTFVKTVSETVVPSSLHEQFVRRVHDMYDIVLVTPEFAHRKGAGVFAMVVYLIMRELRGEKAFINKTAICTACGVSTATLLENLRLAHSLTRG